MLEHAPTQRERLLLLAASVFVALALLTLMIAPAARTLDWDSASWRWDYALSFGIWVLAGVVGHFTLQAQLPHRDPLLFPIVMLLAGWSMALVWRLAPAFGLRQSFWVGIGVLGLMAIITPPALIRWLRRFRYLLLFAALLLTAATFILGVNPSGFGPRLWLGLGGVHFQPAELLKLLLIIFMAAYLADKHELIATGWRNGRWQLPALKYMGPLLLMWGFSLALLFFQQDLGTGSLLFAVFLAMLYLATGQGWYLLVGVLLMGIGGAVLYGMFGVVQVRVDAWLNPWADSLGGSFQIVQSLIAIANGGLIGQGLGLGSPGVIPVVHSDFVYAAIVEEFGLAGGLAVLMLLLVLVFRGLAIGQQANNTHATLLAAGVAALLGLQTLMIVAGVTRALPLTGITLPFLSYGGSALLINFIMVGLLLRLSQPADTKSTR